MASYTIDGKTLTAIADAIREKTGLSDLMLPTDFPAAIRSISGGSSKKYKFERYRTIYPSGGQTSFDVNSSAMSKDGRYFYNKGYVYDFLTTAGTEFSWQVKDEDGNAITVYKASFSPDGKSVYTAKAQPRVGEAQKGYDIVKVTKDSCTTLGSYTANVLAASPYCVNCAPDAEDELYISYFYADKEQVYESKTWFLIDGQVIEGTPKESTYANNGFLFTSDGMYVVGYGYDIQRYSRKTGSPFGEALYIAGGISNFSLSADNNYVVNGSGGTDSSGNQRPVVAVWRISDYQKMFDFNDFFTEQGSAICIPNTNLIVYCYRDGRAVRSFDISTGSPVELSDLPSISGTLGSDSKPVASYNGNRVAIVARDFAEIWNVVEQ